MATGKDGTTAPHAPRSLRDHFASTALAGMEITAQQQESGLYYFSPAEVARRAYQVADAMLRERTK
jgi:hypothetical protein